MRDYSKVSSSFWTGDTGRQLRGDAQAQVIALYLMTSPHANMIGVFHCPMIYIAHDTGSSLQGASKALLRLVEGGFCKYSEDDELVWVVEMAKFQVGEFLKLADNRVKDVQKQFSAIGNQLIRQEFFEKYGENYHLTNEAPLKPLGSTFKAPLKPGTGTGTGKETEEEGKSIASRPASRTHPGFAEFWIAYPKKHARAAAEKAWSSMKPDLQTVLVALAEHKKSDQWAKGIIPHGATWINGRRWEDVSIVATSAKTDCDSGAYNPFRGAI